MPSNKTELPELFQCKKCGDCCKGFGGTYVTEKDIHAIARFLNLDVSTVISKYLTDSGKRKVIAQGDNGYCIFWERFCTIHPVKPKMCKKWPFIEAILKDVKNWHRMAESCSGMRTDVSDEEIINCVKRYLEANRKDFQKKILAKHDRKNV
jgi:Fe-S-cluster containining protein